MSRSASTYIQRKDAEYEFFCYQEQTIYLDLVALTISLRNVEEYVKTAKIVVLAADIKQTADEQLRSSMLDNLVLKPRPRPIPKVTPAPTSEANTNSPAVTVPSNDSTPTPSLVTPTNPDSDAASLSVRKEVLVPAPAKKKARRPSVRPMRIGTKVTPGNLCAQTPSR
ncbi:hypothetical protein F4604DRAFT_1917248 [Suillus subluteus]|nr:hypothetical protein F4604DRAFT_1917248 [Suillus subluteus]